MEIFLKKFKDLYIYIYIDDIKRAFDSCSFLRMKDLEMENLFEASNKETGIRCTKERGIF